MLAQESRSRKPSRLRWAQVTREAQHRVDEYVRQARASGASWQQVGSALGITRQSAWERFRHLPGCEEKGTVASRLPRPPAQSSPQMRKLTTQTEKRVQRMRAEGASWQQVGSALGITRQSAWERFRHLRTGRVTGGVPEGVMLNRHQQPHLFADWVINAATGNESIQRWLEEPDIDLGLMAGFDRPVRPKEILGRSILRDFLMAKGHTNISSNSASDRSPCLICGHEFLNEKFLQSHWERDHKKSATKPR